MIYISTDDPEVLSALPRPPAGVRFIYDHEEPRYNGTHVYAPMAVSMSRWPGYPGNDPCVNATSYAIESVKSVEIMSSADYFVGTVT
jgi:hypothetical protein